MDSKYVRNIFHPMQNSNEQNECGRMESAFANVFIAGLVQKEMNAEERGS